MRRSILIKFSFSLFVIFVGTICLIWQGVNIWNKWMAIQDQKKMVMILKELKTKTDEAYQKIGDIKEVEKKMKMIIPTGPHKEELLVDLQKAGTESGLMLANISFGGTNNEEVNNEGNGNEMVNDKGIGDGGIIGKEANNSNGKVGNKNIENDLSEGRVSDFSIKLSLIGPYSSLKNFLRKVESSRRVIRVTSISFSSGSRKRGSDSDSDFFGFNVSGESYYWSK